MAKDTPTTDAAPAEGFAAGLATPEQNAALEHTEGGKTTRDAMDAGVPMTAGAPDEPVGPEDALGFGPKRGDYSDRLVSGPHAETQIIPPDEREEDGPTSRLVPQGTDVGNVGDAAGKGGVDTDEALEHADELAGR